MRNSSFLIFSVIVLCLAVIWFPGCSSQNRAPDDDNSSVGPSDGGAPGSKSAANYEELNINFYEGPYTTPKLADREYNTSFDKNSVRFIYTETSLQNNLYNVRDQKIRYNLKYYNPDGGLRGETDATVDIPSDMQTPIITAGIGGENFGNYQPGTYSVAVYLDGVKVDEQKFKITDSGSSGLSVLFNRPEDGYIVKASSDWKVLSKKEDKADDCIKNDELYCSIYFYLEHLPSYSTVNKEMIDELSEDVEDYEDEYGYTDLIEKKVDKIKNKNAGWIDYEWEDEYDWRHEVVYYFDMGNSYFLIVKISVLGEYWEDATPGWKAVLDNLELVPIKKK